ncbi:MAG TPA: peptidase S1 [Deferribacteraceae bacterium]|nr:peptidase S1 [Deferribacteraceae bacterium]
MVKKITALLTMLIVFSTAAAVYAAPESFSEVVKKTRDGVVNISTTKTVTRKMPDMFHDDFFRKFFGDQFNMPDSGGKPREYKTSALGSGFVIDAAGLIVTNNHVIDGADEIVIKLNDKHEFKAEVVGKDPMTDLALIKIDPKGVKLTALKLADSDSAEIGDWVVAIGNPLGLEWTVTAGIISGKARALGSGPYDNFMQTDASINPGNSGGPLLNLNGEVVAINTAIIPSGQGLGFAVPVNMLKDILPKLKKGKVDRGWLGVTVQSLDEKIAQGLGLENDEGALIADVVKGDPADKAGVKAGDVVVAINGKPIKDNRELINIIGGYEPNTTVKLTVIRDGKKREIPVKLGVRKDGASGSVSPAEPDVSRPIAVKEVDEATAKKFGVEGGVVVTSIDETTNAFNAGLRNGDIVLWINRQSVKSAEDFYAKYDKVKEGDVVFLKVVSRGSGRFIAFDK